MLVPEFITLVNDALRGTDDDAPNANTDDWSYWLRTANRLRRNLYNDTKSLWPATYTKVNVGTITVDADLEFTLNSKFLAAANQPYIITLDGQRVNLTLLKPEEAAGNYLERTVFITGAQPQKLTFSKEIVTGENIVGGTLYLPGYFMPDDMTDDGDTVVVDDPDWLVVATAAKIAFNDITYEDKSSDLVAEANSLYTQMTSNRRKGVYGYARTTPTNVRRITGPTRQVR